MMKGTNTFGLNQATMQAAVQHYFDTQLFAKGRAPRVTSVRQTRDQGSAGHFEVDTTSTADGSEP